LYVDYSWGREKAQQLLTLQKVQCLGAITLIRNNWLNFKIKGKVFQSTFHFFAIIRKIKGTVVVRILNLLSYLSSGTSPQEKVQ
jgi:hypothetical protein